MSRDDPEGDLATFAALLGGFETAMLVTRHGADLRSRPMAIADASADGCLRFITRDDSGKLSELEDDAHVNVTLQSESTFLSLSGNARLTKEPRVIDETWQEKQSPWFSEGRNDPHVIVIEVVPSFAEYWDRSKVGAVRLAIERARLALSNRGRLDDDSLGEHGTVAFHDRPQ